MFENAIIEPQILKNSDLAFGLFFYSIILCFTILIGELVLSYGTNQKFHQISLNTLFVTGFLTFSYAVCAVIGFDDPALKTVGVILGVILAGVETVYYGVRGRQIMLIINDAINTEAFWSYLQNPYHFLYFTKQMTNKLIIAMTHYLFFFLHFNSEFISSSLPFIFYNFPFRKFVQCLAIVSPWIARIVHNKYAIDCKFKTLSTNFFTEDWDFGFPVMSSLRRGG